MQRQRKVVLALGSNMGEPIENLRLAIEKISAFAKVLSRSQIYKTEPVGYLDQDDFFNAEIIRNIVNILHGIGGKAVADCENFKCAVSVGVPVVRCLRLRVSFNAPNLEHKSLTQHQDHKQA